MPSFAYANARLRAMKARLLTEDDYRLLAELPTLESFRGRLRDTPYQASLEAAVATPGELNAVYRIFQTDLGSTLGAIVEFFDGPDRELVELAVREIDLENFKAIVRGLAHGMPPLAITPALTPTPTVPMSLLLQITRSAGLREAVDTMASLGLEWARPLLAVNGAVEERRSEALERALTRWHYQDAVETAEEFGGRGEPLLRSLRLDIDAVNIVYVVRLAHARRIGGQEPSELPLEPESLISGGNITFSRLESASEGRDPETVLRRLQGTRTGRRLSEALDGVRGYQPAEVDRALWRLKVRQRKRLLVTDPLGVGVFLGYLALKRTELRNLRWIAGSIEAGLEPDEIMNEVELPE